MVGKLYLDFMSCFVSSSFPFSLSEALWIGFHDRRSERGESGERELYLLLDKAFLVLSQLDC